MKKKLLPILLIVVIVFNFICTSNVYAGEPDDITSSLPESNGEGQITTDQAENVMDGETDSSIGSTILGLIFQGIALMLNSFPMSVQAFLTQLSRNPTSTTDPLKQAMEFAVDLLDVSTYYSIQRTVFNEVALFNINVFNMEDDYTIGTGSNQETINQSPTIKKLKETTAGWFYRCRLIAIMINLCVLVYVGIRMAISTIASEEAKYKKMLISWFESMVVLFILHYVMLFAISIGNIIIDILYSLRENMAVEGFETVIMKKIYNAISESTGMQVFMYSIFFWFLTFIQVKFFITYLKRVLTVMFLTIIAPFITVTYPIDKMGDGKAQAFEKWFQEYIINIIIQPIHAGVYLVFVFSAGEIAKTAPFVAMVFLLALGKMENIIRNLFGFNDSVSMKNFNDQLKNGKKG